MCVFVFGMCINMYICIYVQGHVYIHACVVSVCNVNITHLENFPHSVYRHHSTFFEKLFFFPVRLIFSLSKPVIIQTKELEAKDLRENKG